MTAVSVVAACGGGAPSNAAPVSGVSVPDESGPALEVLTNSGLEAQGSPTAIAPGWSYYTPADASADFALEASGQHGGGTAQRISLGSGHTTFMQNLSFKAETKYRAAIWLRADKPTRVQLGLRRADNGYAYALKTVFVPTTWTEFEFYGYTEATNGYLAITVQEPGQVWVDDASVLAWASPLRPYSSASATIPREYFGQHMHQQSNSSAWPSVPFGARRLWDTSANWADIAACAQPAGNGTCASGVQYNWSYLDTKVAEAEAHGVDILFTLARTPSWASARPQEPSPYGNGQSAEPLSDQVWQEWVSAVANRYRGRIKYWEIWNEPNFQWNASPQSFYTGTPEKLLSLQQQAYEVLKRIDPNNVVLTPAFTDVDYIEYYLSIGGGQSADILAYHFYVSDAPEVVYQHLGRTLQFMAAHKTPGLPVWNTEQGWVGAPIDPYRGAAFLARSYILNWASGIARYYWYAWDNHGMAVQTTQGDNVSLAPAGVAYGVVENWLVGRQLVNLRIDAGGNWIAELNGPSGASYVVWNPNQSATFMVPGEWQVSRVQNLSGADSNVSPGASLTVNDSPLLLSR